MGSLYSWCSLCIPFHSRVFWGCYYLWGLPARRFGGSQDDPHPNHAQPPPSLAPPELSPWEQLEDFWIQQNLQGTVVWSPLLTDWGTFSWSTILNQPHPTGTVQWRPQAAPQGHPLFSLRSSGTRGLLSHLVNLCKLGGKDMKHDTCCSRAASCLLFPLAGPQFPHHKIVIAMNTLCVGVGTKGMFTK